MQWDLRYCDGAGALRFGMSPVNVAALIGAPKRTRETEQHKLRESRSLDQPMLYFQKNGLDEIIFTRFATNVMLNGRDVFRSDPFDILKMVSEVHQDCVDSFGIIVSVGAGLSFTGFHDGDISQKAVGLFARGVWTEPLKRGAKPISF